MWPYFAPYKWLMFLAIIASIITASTNGALAVAVKYVFDNMFKPNDYTYLYILPITVVLIYVAKSSFLFMQGFLMSFIGNKVIEKLRNETFEKMIRLPVKYYSDQSTGALMSRITNDINLVQSSIPTIISMFRAVLTMIGLIGVIIYMNYKLALIAIVLYPIFIFPLSIISKKLRKYSHLGQERMGDLTSVLQESFSGIRVVKAFVAEDKEVERFEKANAQTIKYANKSVLAGNLASPLTEALGSFGIGAVLLMGGYQVISGTSTTGTFIAFLAALVQIYEPVKLFANSNNALQASIAATDRVFSMFDEEDEVIENKGSVECNAEGKDIEFKNVSKIYGEKESKVMALNETSFSIEKGELVVILGPSGAGKTTALNILGGMDKVTSGEVIIDGKDITKYSNKELIKYRRNDIGFVFQFYNLVQNLTAKENVELATEICKKHLSPVKTLKVVGLENRLNNFPAQLSGGEQQRVAIARAVAKSPKILLADEPTGALDDETGKQILKVLEKLARKNKMTVIIITHNSAIAPIADKIIRFKKTR